MANMARYCMFVTLPVSGGGDRRFASVDIAVAHHELYIEHKLSFARRLREE